MIAGAVEEARRPPPDDGDAVFDPTLFMEYLDGDLDLAQRVIAMLLETLPESLASIRQAVAARDSLAVRASAHSIKGALGSFAAPTVVAAAYRLELMGTSGELGDAAAACADLDRAAARLAVALSAFVRELVEAGPLGDRA